MSAQGIKQARCAEFFAGGIWFLNPAIGEQEQAIALGQGMEG